MQSLTPDELQSAYIEFFQKAPGFGETFDLSRPGMHQTHTIDYGIIISGQVYLELDGEEKVLLKTGDSWVQNGTIHAWRNPFDEPCISAVVMIGMHEK